MKTKILLSVIATAIITLSFTVGKTKNKSLNINTHQSVNKNQAQPIGGLELEDKN